MPHDFTILSHTQRQLQDKVPVLTLQLSAVGAGIGRGHHSQSPSHLGVVGEQESLEIERS